MDELEKSFPEGLTYDIGFDTTPYTRESIHEVFKTLCATRSSWWPIVVLVFLQNWRSAIIPLVAVPVAIVGTFAAMAAFGFSLNNLTLFGLVLAIGIVVDDAIVVVEAVEHHIEHGLSPREATIKAMEQVSGPGDRRRTGAVGRVRAVRVHQRHHGSVLPAVRPDDRRLDDHLGLQFADAEPGPDGRSCCGPQRQRSRSPPLPLAGVPLIAGGRSAGFISAPWAVRLAQGAATAASRSRVPALVPRLPCAITVVRPALWRRAVARLVGREAAQSTSAVVFPLV